MVQKYTFGPVATHFYNYPTKRHYLKGIAREINLAHTSVSTQLKRLVRLAMVKKQIEKRGRRSFPYYVANLVNNDFLFYKAIQNLIALKESGILNLLQDECQPDAIVLFGSYQHGEDIEESDIDLFIQCDPMEIKLQKYESRLNRKIQLHFKANLGEYPEELQSSILNGTVLYGYLEIHNDTSRPPTS